MRAPLFLTLTLTFLAGCSAPAPQAQTKQPGAPQITTSVISSKHPLSKFLELAGFRLSEKGAGKLAVKFAVINHSDADIGDLKLKVRLLTTASGPLDPPVAEFLADVPALGPQEIKDVTTSTETKLRIYEMPDWQFIRAEAEILAPAP